MPRKRTVVDVLFTSKSKYEVIRIDSGGPIPFTESIDFYVFRNGEQVAGRYADLRDAIAWAERQGARR